MKKKFQLLMMLTLLVQSTAFAQSNHHHDHAHTEALSPMQQEYAHSMQVMHEGMEKAVLYSDPDVAFAAGMLPHHEGAVQMAKIQLKYGKDPVLRQLAQEIIDAQQSEIQLMQNWLNKQMPAK